jgi:hypothetical protein
MDVDRITYRQLDELLTYLGFSRRHIEPKWRRYDHAASDTVIIVIEKGPDEPVRISDAISARLHLVEKGLISAEDLAKRLAKSATAKKSRFTKKKV